MSTFFVQASKAINNIMLGKTECSSSEDYSSLLQRLYIRYIRLMATYNEFFILSPRAFFIYLVPPKRNILYTAESLEEKIKELVRDSQFLDKTPTEIIGGKHIRAIKIFSAL